MVQLLFQSQFVEIAKQSFFRERDVAVHFQPKRKSCHLFDPLERKRQLLRYPCNLPANNVDSGLIEQSTSYGNGSFCQRDKAHDGVQQRCFATTRSEEHTSELQSRQYLVCRLLLEK